MSQMFGTMQNVLNMLTHKSYCHNNQFYVHFEFILMLISRSRTKTKKWFLASSGGFKGEGRGNGRP